MTLQLRSPRECRATYLLESWLSQLELLESRRASLQELMRVESLRHGEPHLGQSISSPQITNLLLLARGLLCLPERDETFSMRSFRAEANHPPLQLRATTPVRPYERAEPVCGTVACAVGYAPAILQIPMPVFSPNLGRMNNSWMEFSYEVFGPLPSGLWEWCFDGSWRNIDNTTHGAAARIVHMIVTAPSLPYDLNTQDELDTSPWDNDPVATDSYASLLQPERGR